MADNKIDNQKRLAKNTLVLYARSLITMVIGIYASRVVLQVLGVNDYGLYSLIGGFVGVFQMISATFVSSTQRAISYEMGKNDINRIQQTFSASIHIHLILILFLIVVFETVGLWLLSTKLNIPEGRECAAMWLYQCTIASFLINILCIPYNALIVAKEKMSVFAYVSIYEAVAKLGILYILSYSRYDKLSTYAVLLLAVSLSVRFFWSLYCKLYIEESKIIKVEDRSIYKSMTNMSTWIFLGSSASIFTIYGLNIVINIFFGVAINAAKGIASQIENAITMLVNNFTMSLKPQITKAYASGDVKYMWTLVNTGSRMAFYLMAIMVIPIITVKNELLSVWLKDVPLYASSFLSLVLLYILIGPFKTILDAVLLAEGNVRNWQIISSIIDFCNIPSAYLFYKFGAEPHHCYSAMFVISLLSLINRLYFCKKNISIDLKNYIINVFSKAWGVLLISLFVCQIVAAIPIANVVLRLFIIGGASFLISAIIIYIYGLRQNEKEAVDRIIKNKMSVLCKV